MAKGTIIPGLNGVRVRSIINNNDSELYNFKDSTFLAGNLFVWITDFWHFAKDATTQTAIYNYLAGECGLPTI